LLVYFLYALFFISCIVLIVSILLQPGKTDAGALFTSNISSTAFGPRGTSSVLSKITIAAAAGFMLSALLLALPAVSGDVSVIQTTPTTATEPETLPANANNVVNTTIETNSNTSVIGNTTLNSNTNVNK